MTFEIGTTTDTADLDRVIARMERLPAIIAKYADLIVQDAKHLARVDTGAMRDSVVAHLDGLTAEITIGEGLPDARAVWNEYGTARMPAAPMLRPAMERYGPAFVQEVAALFGG